MGNKNERTWLTVEEVADRLRCSVRYIREAVSNRDIPFTMFAGRALFHRDRIDEWLLAHEEGPFTKDDPGNVAESGYATFDTEIVENPNVETINNLVQKLIDFGDQWVERLGRNLMEVLSGSDYRSLSPKVYAQLSRWCHARRRSRRELTVEPIVHELSNELFGRVIPRTKHPTYQAKRNK